MFSIKIVFNEKQIPENSLTFIFENVLKKRLLFRTFFDEKLLLIKICWERSWLRTKKKEQGATPFLLININSTLDYAQNKLVLNLMCLM